MYPEFESVGVFYDGDYDPEDEKLIDAGIPTQNSGSKVKTEVVTVHVHAIAYYHPGQNPKETMISLTDGMGLCLLEPYSIIKEKIKLAKLAWGNPAPKVSSF